MKRKKKRQLTGLRLDRHRCATAYREVGTLGMDLMDWIEDLKRYRGSQLKIDHQDLLLESLRESRKAVDALIEELR